MNKLERFKNKKVFLPVIHPAYGEKGIFDALEVTMKAEADGVFVINQGMSLYPLLRASEKIKALYPNLWLGANLLNLSPVETLEYAHLYDGIWVDDCGVDYQLTESQLKIGGYTFNEFRGDWKGLYFGGTAFKTQKQITDKDKLTAVAKQAVGLTDIVTTSGAATGVAAPIEKIQMMRSAIGPDVPLGIASGITVENVVDFLEFVDVFLVASGIEKSFGILDEEKTIQLSKIIHGENIK